MRSVHSLKTQSPTIIVGAGVSGLWLSRLLKHDNHPSTIVEKSNVYGGRMATRTSYINSNTVKFDTGAQYYSQKEPMNLITDYWQIKCKPNESSKPSVWFHKDNVARLRSTSGMSNLAKSIAISSNAANNDDDDLNIQFKQRVSAIKRISSSNISNDKKDKWMLYFENNTIEPLECDRVILTCPLPQSLDILKDSDISFDPALSSIEYAKALVGLFEINPNYNKLSSRNNKDGNGNIAIESSELTTTTTITAPPSSSSTIGLNLVGNPLVKEDSNGFYTMNSSSTSIYSIVDQQRKGVSSLPAWTAVMHPEFSERYYSSPDAEVMEAIHQELLRVDPTFCYSPYTSASPTVPTSIVDGTTTAINNSADNTAVPFYGHLKRWKFSHPTSTYKDPFVEIEDGLYLAGDSFGGGSINGAVISANALAAHLKAKC